MNRDYVILSLEHSTSDYLIFWGRHTQDDEQRSFGGYTRDLNKCERYTRDELEQYRGGDRVHYPFFDELAKKDFWKQEEVLMTLDDLETMGFYEARVMMR